MRSAKTHLDKARRCLASGAYLLAGDFPDQAGRDAYMAAFHAALALIMWRTGKEPKTHNGTHTEFARLVREYAGLDLKLMGFLSRSYDLKSVADYDDGTPVSRDEASSSLATSAEFVDTIVAIIPPSALA
jgi:uncharacterized protein (UPF0332 family)